MKFIRKPVFTTFTLLVVGCVVYFMSSTSSDLSLGASIPINMAKDYIKTPEKNDFVAEEPAAPDAAAAAPLPVAQQPLVKGNGKTKGEDFGIQIEEDLTVVHEDKPVSDDADISDKTGKLDSFDDKTTGITDTPFMPKMANETLKAQLGNAAWKLFHTILARYPDKPTQPEKTTLSQYIQLFAQVYPCGDCARHFQKLLKKYPPQIGSRKTAALWGCDIHNKVNDRLKKPIYDCTTILEDYDCGCGDDEKQADFTLDGGSIDSVRGSGEGVSGKNSAAGAKEKAAALAAKGATGATKGAAGDAKTAKGASKGKVSAERVNIAKGEDFAGDTAAKGKIYAQDAIVKEEPVEETVKGAAVLSATLDGEESEGLEHLKSIKVDEKEDKLQLGG